MTAAELSHLWEVSLTSLEQKLALVPDDQPGLDDPNWSGTFAGPEGPLEEQAMTPRQLMTHLVVISYEVPRAFVEGAGFEAVGAASKALAGSSPSQLVTALQERVPKTLAMIGGLDDAALSAVRQTPLMSGTLAEIILLALLHVAHHKGQFVVELRRMGLRPGRFI